LIAKHLIDDDNKPIAWEKRQFASDSSAERVRKHRERKRQEQKQGCNVTETKSNAIEAETDTDTDNYSSSARDENSQLDHENPPPPTRKGHLCKLLREIGIDAAPHTLGESDWAEILARRTDEEIIAFAEVVMQKKKGQRVSLRYLAPGLLDTPERVPPERGKARGSPSRPMSAVERVREANPLPGDFSAGNGQIIDIGGSK
jgi:hypothetical protein